MSNTQTITGNIGQDAKFKYLDSGAALLKFSVADNPRRKTEQGWENAGETTWYEVSVWGPFAAAIHEANLAVKGAQAIVTGTLTPRPFESNGQQRISFDVRADTLGFPEKRNAGQSPQQRTAPQQQQDDPWASSSRGADEIAPF